MNDATLAQGNQVLNLILQKKKSKEQLKLLQESGLLSDLLDADVSVIDREKFREFIGLEPLVVHRARRKREKKQNIPQFRALDDAEVPVRFADMLAKWRRLAKRLNYAGRIAWLVPAGFHIKKHAPFAGPCYDQFRYLQDWTLGDEENEPTKRQLVFWIPRVIPKSNKKNAQKQRALLAEFWQEYDLPDYHLTKFGQASLLAGLILKYYQLTKEKIPLHDDQWVRTDTQSSDGRWLLLGGQNDSWLSCGRCKSWAIRGADDSDDKVWCFPIGMENLEPGELEAA